MVVIPQVWVDRYSTLPNGWLEANAPGLLAEWPAGSLAVDYVASVVNVDPRLLVTRAEFEQSAISMRAGDTRWAHALRYLCGADRTGSGDRDKGWFGPELQLLACALRFKAWYRGRGGTYHAPDGTSEQADDWANWLGLAEDPRYQAGVRAPQGIIPSNQASADHCRYTEDPAGPARMREIGRRWFAEDYDAEEGGGTVAEKRLRIALDPGHGTLNAKGGRDPGTAGGGLAEHAANWGVAQALAARLRADGHNVTLSRAKDPNWLVRLGPTARGRWAAALACDVFVSIHHDSNKDSAPRGCTAFYYSEDAPNGKKLAKELTYALSSGLGVLNRGAMIHWDGLSVLSGGENWKHSGAACLVECCFMSNAADLAIIQADGYADRAAAAIQRGIYAYAKLEAPTPIEPPAPSVPDWAAEAWAWAKEAGLIDGTRPDASVTRQELATVLYRMKQL